LRALAWSHGREGRSDGPMASIGIPPTDHNSEESTIMNVKGEIKGDVLHLTIDLSKAARDAAKDSKSGKTKLLASTNGFTGFGDVKVSLNATIDK
jgi:hypothetical protein